MDFCFYYFSLSSTLFRPSKKTQRLSV